MPARQPRIASRAVRPVISGLLELGYDARSLIAAANIDPKDLNHPDGTIPFSQMGALWRQAESSSGDDSIGIHVAEYLPLDSLDIHTFAMRASTTLREALRIAVSFQRLIHETTVLEFEEGKGRAALKHRLPGGGGVPRQPAEFLATLWIRVAREVVPGTWSPPGVSFAHAKPKDLGEHRRVFGDHITYDSNETALYLSDDVLDKRNTRAEPALLSLLKQYVGTLPRFPVGATTAERIRDCLSARWPLTTSTAEDIAKKISLSVRSMNRALQAEGTSFTSVRTAVRMERADALLSRTDVAIAEVAFATGFSELSAFYRAFRRWHGKSPAEWRRNNQP